MATATITLKKGTTAEWTESKRVLDDGELGLETTTSGHRIIRIGNGSTEFMSLPVAFDIEEVREIKTGMDKDAKTYYDDMVKKGTELLAEMKALAKQAGVDAHKVFPHNLRHLFAITYYSAYRDIVRLADVLGHSSVETTRIYLLTSGAEHLQQLERLKLVS